MVGSRWFIFLLLLCLMLLPIISSNIVEANGEVTIITEKPDSHLSGNRADIPNHSPNNALNDIKDIRASAEAGNAGAQYVLGFKYHKGIEVTKDDVEAVHWFQKAADQNDTLSQVQLGNAYYLGRGIAKNEAEAERLWRIAADNDDKKDSIAPAKTKQEFDRLLGGAEKGGPYANIDEFFIGLAYKSRDSAVKQNYSKAAKWFRKAADKHHAFAQHFLGDAYYLGHGVPKDEAEAIKWWHLSAETGEHLK